MATPHVAGAIAAVRSACPSATADAIENALKSTGTPITDTRPGGTQTKPRIRVDLAVQSLSCNPPANDNFANAIAISARRDGGRHQCQRHQGIGEPNHAGNAGGKSVWWSFTPSANGQVTVNTAGSSFDTLLGVYTGSAVNALTLVASNNDVGGGTLTSALSFAGVSGTTYYIAVDGLNGASGSITLFADQAAPAGPVSCTFPSRLGDINGDGKADYGAAPQRDGLLAGYLMNGTQVQSAAMLGTVDPAFNDGRHRRLQRRRQGRPAVPPPSDGTVAMAMMNGLQVTQFQLLGAIGIEWNMVGVGDFNGDGKADFMTRRIADGMLAIYSDERLSGPGRTAPRRRRQRVVGRRRRRLRRRRQADFITRRADGVLWRVPDERLPG